MRGNVRFEVSFVRNEAKGEEGWSREGCKDKGVVLMKTECEEGFEKAVERC